MEDILASIRRIIADDQTQGLRSGYGGSAENSPPQNLALAEADLTTETAPAAGRSRLRLQDDYEAVLDLAGVPEAALAESVPLSYEEPREPDAQQIPSMTEEPEHNREPAVAAKPSFSADEVVAPEPPALYRNGLDPSSLLRIQRDDQETAHMDFAGLQTSMFRPDEHDEPSLQAESGTSGEALISPALGASVMSAFETLAATVVLQNTDMLERVMRELLRPLVKTWLDENLPTLVERLVRNEIERVARGGRG